MNTIIDLRSDTVTRPTSAMREAMAKAEVGDDVYQDDPTVRRLEALSAEMMGKEAALFVPSGTMGNQLAVMTHTQPGNELIAGMNSHIVHYEAGAAAKLSGAAYALAANPDDFVYPEDVRRLVRPRGNLHFPVTSLLCLENALSNGGVVPLEIMKASAEAAWELGLKVHLDGARIFNAALALGVQAAAIASCADSVMFCVSKGLCAPVGSLLCGNRSFVEEARYNRKILGGGMRQSGILAAAGIVALEQMTGRLQEDHDNARYLGELLAAIPGITVQKERIKINMVFWKTSISGFASEAFVEFMGQRGIKITGYGGEEYRFVTSHEVSRAEIETTVEALKAYIETCR